MVPDQFDLVLTGGNGGGIARDAAGREQRVLLCEENDLAQGTSPPKAVARGGRDFYAPRPTAAGGGTGMAFFGAGLRRVAGRGLKPAVEEVRTSLDAAAPHPVPGAPCAR